MTVMIVKSSYQMSALDAEKFTLKLKVWMTGFSVLDANDGCMNPAHFMIMHVIVAENLRKTFQIFA